MLDDLATTRQRGADANALIREFVGPRSDHYALRFEGMLRGGLQRGGFNIAAAIGGPIWCAARGLWWLFWSNLSLDLLALILLVNGTVSGTARTSIASWGLWGGLALLAVTRSTVGFLGNGALFAQYNRWRADRKLISGVSIRRAVQGLFLILCVLPLVVYRTTRVAPTVRECRNVWGQLNSPGEWTHQLEVRSRSV